MKDGKSLGHIGDASVATRNYGDQYLKVCTIAFIELVKRLYAQD
jgi:hypothetical protein